MKEINVLIVEDEPIISEHLADCIEQFGYSVFAKCYTIQDAISRCTYRRPDIAILDINLKDEKDGVDLACFFNREYDFPIIFLTSYIDQQKFDKAKKSNPVSYLIKPFDQNNLKASICLGLHNYELRKQNKQPRARKFSEEEMLVPIRRNLFIKEKGRYIKVAYRDILWIEANDAYCGIHTNGGRYLVHSSLKKLEEKLDPSIFARVHRSYIINLNHIDQVETESVYLANQEISISKTYRSSFFDSLNLL